MRIELIREYSSDFGGGAAQLELVIKSLLHLIGARTRYWLASNESPHGLIKNVNVPESNSFQRLSLVLRKTI